MSTQHSSERSVLLDGEDQRIARMPILVLNAHSRCNCRCVMCDIWKREGRDEISAADLERHRESLRRLHVEWVVLSGGEPLMHGDLGGLCSFFRELDIRLTLLTTGLLLERRATEVARLFDDIIVSLDGPPDIHDAIRRVKGGFNLIQKGIDEIHRVRPALQITARTTVQKANHRSLQETVRCAKTLGLSGISFLAADVTSEAFNRLVPWPGDRQNEIAVTLDEIPALEREVEELIVQHAEDIATGYIAESPAKLRRIVKHFKARFGYAPHESPQCNAPWVSAVIEADGTVRPCFFHRAIGNIHNAGLEDIINGESANVFRRDLHIASNPICQSCVCSLHLRNESISWTKLPRD